VRVYLEADLEIADVWDIVIEADVTGIEPEEIFSRQQRWSRGIFERCPSTHVCLFSPRTYGFLMSGRDFLPLAQRLAAGPTEAEWRTAVSRAYYAAFHVARLLMTDLGFAVPRDERGAYPPLLAPGELRRNPGRASGEGSARPAQEPDPSGLRFPKAVPAAPGGAPGHSGRADHSDR